MSGPMIKQMGFSTLEPNLELLLGIFHLLWARYNKMLFSGTWVGACGLKKKKKGRKMWLN